MSRSVTIAVEGPWYFSEKDEEVFYGWLNSIPSVVAHGGVRTVMHISLARKRLPQRDLRELIALFHRYAMDKRVLAQFDRPELTWFRDPQKYWYAEVFGKAPRGTKRR